MVGPPSPENQRDFTRWMRRAWGFIRLWLLLPWVPALNMMPGWPSCHLSARPIISTAPATDVASTPRAAATTATTATWIWWGWWFFMSNCWMNYVNHVSLDSEEILETTDHWQDVLSNCSLRLLFELNSKASTATMTTRSESARARRRAMAGPTWRPLSLMPVPWAPCLPRRMDIWGHWCHHHWAWGVTHCLPIRKVTWHLPALQVFLPSLHLGIMANPWRPTGFPALGRGPIDPAPSLGRLCVPLGRREPLPPRHVGPISRAWSLPSSHRDSEPPPATHGRDVPHEPGSWVCQTSFGACYVTWCSSILSPGLGCHPRLSGGDCDRSGDVIHAVWMLSCLHCNGLSTPQGYIGPQLHPLYLDPTISDPSQHVRRENLSHRESAMAGGALSERVTEKLDREERCIDGRSMPKYLKWPPQRSQVRNGIAQVLPYFLFCIFPTSSWNLSGPSKSQRTLTCHRPAMPKGGSRGHGILTHRVTVPRTQLGYRLGQAEWIGGCHLWHASASKHWKEHGSYLITIHNL